ncbi:MAG: hypothetical protein IJO33_03785 [Bacilli bacterium]|nr:hypothetical protein [Bacilli bacterium]
MKIQIKDTSKVKTESESLQDNAAKMQEIQNEIENILSSLKSYWDQNQEDAQKFYGDLKTNSARLKTIYENSSEFSSAMIEYINYVEKNSQQSL